MSLRFEVIFFIVLYLLGASVNGQKDVRTFIFGHSLIHHEYQVNPTPSQETSLPHWFQLLVNESSHAYAVSGQYGFLPQHANVPPIPNWGFDIVDGAWDSDIESFTDAGFTNILITPGNFIQYQGPSVNYYNETISPVDATETIINWCQEQEEELNYYIYENWPDMAGYLSNGFPPTASEWDNYNNYLKRDFHDWFLEYHDSLLVRIPDVTIKMIPVGPIISDLLQISPFDNIAIDTLYEDDAPHGRPTIYFLGALITYMAMYQEPAPSAFPSNSFIDPIVNDNYADVVDFIWKELNDFNFNNGESRVFLNETTTSIANINLEIDAIELRPNPSLQEFEITGLLNNYTIQILDAVGTIHQTLDNSGPSLQVNIHDLPSGLYFVHIVKTNNELLCVKTLIKN